MSDPKFLERPFRFIAVSLTENIISFTNCRQAVCEGNDVFRVPAAGGDLVWLSESPKNSRAHPISTMLHPSSNAVYAFEYAEATPQRVRSGPVA